MKFDVPNVLKILVLLASVAIVVTAFVLRGVEALPWDQVVGMVVTGLVLGAISGRIVYHDIKRG